MDIQSITDRYSCAQYVLNYINKSKRGISKVLFDTLEDLKAGNFDLQTKLKTLANKFINASEFSAQEAVYFVLGIPLSKNSRATVFINTNVPEKRVSVVKGKKDLEKMDENSTNVVVPLLDHYANRPNELADECLASFAANYNYSSSKRAKTVKQVVSDFEDDSDNKYEKISNELLLKNKMCYIYKRSRSKIIRYCNPNNKTSIENN